MHQLNAKSFWKSKSAFTTTLASHGQFLFVSFRPRSPRQTQWANKAGVTGQ